MTLDQIRSDLLSMFRQQAQFATGYSPLYAMLFSIVGDWLEFNSRDPLVDWLLNSAQGRRPLDVTLLLVAGVHKQVLAGEPAADGVATAFPTVGGAVPTSETGRRQLASDLYDVIEAQTGPLGRFLKMGTVQTNETARGLAWLLPVSWTGWREIHLAELGASAGLNLVAEQRGYRVAPESGRSGPAFELGFGPVQFETAAWGHTDSLTQRVNPIPYIVSRTGGDQAPFPLRTEEDELNLASFVWGDQPDRLLRLWDGIRAFHAVNESAAPVQLYELHLPDGLSGFMRRVGPESSSLPMVVFNTAISFYLPQQGAGLVREMAAWASQQTFPVLWLQWELPQDPEARPPEESWLAWMAHLWQDGERRQWLLGWVHPHGTRLKWEREAGAFQAYWRTVRGAS